MPGNVLATGFITITDLNDGEGGYSIVLSTENVAFPSDNSGSNYTITGGETIVKLYKGTQEITPTIPTTISAQYLTNCTVTVSGATVAIATVSADAGWVDIPVYDGAFFVGTKRFGYTKAKQGLPGAQGAKGKNFVSQGTWITGKAYKNNWTDGTDIVTYNGSTFYCLQDHTSGAEGTATAPSNATPPVSNAYWGVMAGRGPQGYDATSYWLVGSAASIKKSTLGVHTPYKLTFNAKSQTGTGTPTNYAGRFAIDESADGETWVNRYTTGSTDESSTSHEIKRTIKAIRVRLYKAGGTTVLLDEQTIPVVEEGANVISVALTNETHTVPTDSSGAVNATERAKVLTNVVVYRGAAVMKAGGTNKWLRSRYTKASAGATEPTKEELSGLTRVETDTLLTDAAVTASQALGDNYIGIITTYVRCTTDVTITPNIYYDDSYRIYVNDVLQSSGVGAQTSKAITLTLQKGMNKIECLWGETSGGDGFGFTTALSGNANITKMNCYGTEGYELSIASQTPNIGVTINGAGDGINAPTDSALFTTDSGNVVLTVTTADGMSINRTFTWAKGKGGATGVGYRNRGAWVANANPAYVSNSQYIDTVSYGGEIYALASQGSNSDATWTAGNWTKLVAKGASGSSLYTWIKYADDALGTNMNDSPDGKKYIGIAYNKASETASGTASDYAWTLLSDTSLRLLFIEKQDVLFPFENSLSSTKGLNPVGNPIANLRKNGGKFGSAVAIEEQTTNIVGNPYFDANWTPSAYATQEVVTVPFVDGKNIKALKLVYSGSGDGYTRRVILLPTTPNRTFTFSFWVKQVGNEVGTYSTTFLQFSKASGAATVCQWNPGSKVPNEWTEITITGTTPADTTSNFNVILRPLSSATGHILYAFPQVEEKSFKTSFVDGSRANGSLEYSFTPPSDFTMMGYKRHLLESAFTNFAVTKSGTTFNFYKNGVADTSYRNKWVGYAMTGVHVNNKTWDIASYVNPNARTYHNDFIQKTAFHSSNLTTAKCGYLFRTFVYASANKTIWHRYNADNFGGVRVNNGTPQNTGGWMNAPVNSTNPDIRIDLVKGWNVVEIWYMDSDTGGAITLEKNSGGANSTGPDTGATFVNSIPLSSVPEVIYMTAEMPVEFSSNKIYFNEKTNALFDEIFIASRVLSASDIKAIVAVQQSFIDKDMLDWLNDWDSSSVITNGGRLIAPKLFVGTNGAVNPGVDNPILTGIAIGRDVLGGTDATIGIVGYNDNNITFKMETTGEASFGSVDGRRFRVYSDGSVLMPKILADEIDANQITVDHLASGFGRALDISSNVSITSKVDKETYENYVNTTAGTLETVKTIAESALLKVSESEIVGTVTKSTTFKDIIGAKADSSTLGSYATLDHVAGVKSELEGDISAAVADIDFSPYVKTTDLSQTVDGINARISSGGGINIIRNSVGFAGTDFWTKTGNAISQQGLELEARGAGSGFVLTGAANLTQKVSVVSGRKYTISALIKKIATGTGSIKITNAGAVTTITLSARIYDYEKVKTTVTAAGGELTIELISDSTATGGITFTSVMLNVGEIDFEWTHAVNELYNTNIQMNINGLKVVKMENGAAVGYTTMTPTTFAGYYNNDGIAGINTAPDSDDEVFRMDKDEFVMKKTVAKEEITMGTLRVLRVNNTAGKGWAFVSIV